MARDEIGNVDKSQFYGVQENGGHLLDNPIFVIPSDGSIARADAAPFQFQLTTSYAISKKGCDFIVCVCVYHSMFLFDTPV